MGLVLGLSALTKVSGLVFCPLVAFSLLLIRRRIDKHLCQELAIIGLITLIVGGWWYGRNALIYRDPFTLNAHLYQSTQPRPLATYFWQDLLEVERTFWGNFTRVFVSTIWLEQVATWWGRITLMVAIGAALRHHRCITQRWRELAILALWPLVFGIFLMGFWTRQANWAWGRFLLPAFGPIMILAMLGWHTLLRGHWLRWGILGATGTMVWIGILTPWVTIYPLYHPYRPLKTLDYPVGLVLQTATGEPVATFLGYNLPQPYTTPGSYTPVEICWETHAVTDKPMTKFVQLIELNTTQEGRWPGSVGGRNTYPGLGNLPTDRWPLGKQFCDWVLVKVSDTNSTPMAAALEIGLWDTETGERLAYFTPDGQPVGWTVFKGLAIVDEVALSIAEPDSPHHVFDNRIYLLHLAYTHTMEQLVITTTWTTTNMPTYDAVLFVHAHNEAGHLLAQVDRQPLSGRYPTSYWYPGLVVTDTFALDLPPATPVTFTLGLYTLPDVLRLPLTDINGQQLPDNVIRFVSHQQ